jgi:TetR/AcrR family transcriptional regulator, transcriptional repressor for nem operon
MHSRCAHFDLPAYLLIGRVGFVDTRTQIIEVAGDLIQKVGVAGFSYADVAEAVGIRKASIHYHFPSKGDLVEAVAADIREVYGALLMQAIEGPDPWAPLDVMVEKSRAMMQAGQQMCPASSMLASRAALSDGAAETMRTLMCDGMAGMGAAFDRGRAAGVMQFVGAGEDQARLVMSAMLGAVQGAGLLGPEHFDRVVVQIRRSLGAAEA